MSFFTKLMQDAAPKANTLTNAIKNVANNVANSKAVQTSGAIAYKGLVNTVGVGMVLAQPAVEKTKELATSAWQHVEKLAEKK